jgi:chromosome segregation ATPase
MSNPEALIRIREKLASLLGQYHALMQEKQRLTSEIEKLKGLLAQERSQQEVLNTQLSAAKLKTTSLSESEKAAFEKKINHYIKEIDRCISQLGN